MMNVAIVILSVLGLTHGEGTIKCYVGNNNVAMTCSVGTTCSSVRMSIFVTISLGVLTCYTSVQ